VNEGDAVRIAAHAKLNLFLRILAREAAPPGGYHQIETAFALLELADDLVVSRTRTGVELAVHGSQDLGPPEQNLAVRAARAVLEATGNTFGVAIELTKRVPVRAGLGGGSSDAAAALHAVNALANGVVPRHELLHFGARLGADVAFFASGAPAAIAWGRGERLLRLDPLPAAPALIAVPSVAIATPDAYRWWDELYPEPAARGPVVLDAPAFATGEAWVGWAGTTSRARCSANIPRYARSTKSWPRPIQSGCGCAARGAPWPRCMRPSRHATTRR